jgi:transposase
VPVLAKGKCRTGRLWTYVRDDRPFAGTAAPAAAFFYSADRGGVHPDAHLATYAGLMQADAYAGFNRLYEAGRKPGPIVEAMCWAHARRKFFDLARLNKAPIAIEAVERIDALFAIERDINGKPPPQRRRVRNDHSRPLATALETWLRKQRAKLSAKNEVAKAIARDAFHHPLPGAFAANVNVVRIANSSPARGRVRRARGRCGAQIARDDLPSRPAVALHVRRLCPKIWGPK